MNLKRLGDDLNDVFEMVGLKFIRSASLPPAFTQFRDPEVKDPVSLAYSMAQLDSAAFA